MSEESQSILVVPDLHGRLDALEALLRVSGFVDAKGALGDPKLWLVQLGDMVDRGPQPRACVDRLMELQSKVPERVQVLLGNHEEMVLESDRDPMIMRMWLSNGGSSTRADYEGKFEAWLQPGGKHYEWFRKLPRHFEYKNVLFCHAGLGKLRKGKLDAKGLLWDRPPLERGSYRAVVCGHTPTASGTIEENKGVFCCDLGLGHGTEKSIQALVLSVSDKVLRTETVRV